MTERSEPLEISTHAEPDVRSGRAGAGRIAFLAAKLVITCACFAYLARSVDFADALRAAHKLDVGWGILAVLLLCLQTPLVGLRLRRIMNAIDRGHPPLQPLPAIAITAIGGFFAQVMPTLAAETVRVWMLTQLGHGWRESLLGVMLDRAVGVFMLVAIGFCVLLFPSALAALGGHQHVVVTFFGIVLVIASAGLLFAPKIAGILELSRYTRWAGTLARAAHKVLLGPADGAFIFGIAFAVHLLAIASVWCLGRALGLTLPVLDAGVLLTLMVGISLIPISISGWGVRELAVTTLLGGHGVPLEESLFFSISFGLALIVAALPGALIWAIYSPRPPAHQAAAPAR